jgi:hypothetical protein
MDVAWGKLVPQAPQPVQTMKAKSFLSGATPFPGAGGSEPPPPHTIDDKQHDSDVDHRMPPAARLRLSPKAGGHLAANVFSRSRLSSSTLTLGSPKTQRLRDVVWRSTSVAILSCDMPRAFATRSI